MDKKKISSLIIILVIIVCIVGIWFIKNGKEENYSDLKNQNIPETNLQNSGEINSGDTALNPDFELEVKDTLDMEKLKSYGLPIIIDFGADYCMPCREMEPELKAIHDKTIEKAIVRFVDVEREQEIAYRYPVQLIPTQILINADGTPYMPSGDVSPDFHFYGNTSGEHILTAHVGMLTEEEMEKILKEMGMDE